MDDKLSQIRALLEMDAGGGPTFAELWRRYYREEARYLRTARDVAHRGAILLRAWGTRIASSLTSADAEDYRDRRKAAITRRHRAPMPATINRELACARRCLQWALEQRPPLLRVNPLASVRMEAERNVRRTKIRTEEELERLLELADRAMRALILAQIDCGFRRMEVLTLQWTQLALVRYRSRTTDTLMTRPMAELWDTKNGERRRVALSWRTFEAIQDLPRIGRYVFVGREPGNRRTRESPARPGTHLAPSATLAKFKRLVDKAGLVGVDGEPITFHTLRHSFAYLTRVRDRIPERQVMKQGGWKTRSAFDRYGVGDEDELSEMYEVVDANIAAELARRTKPPKR